MKLKFTKLIIDNFLSFGHAEVDLNDRGYTLIEGINNNPKDSAKSNGAGKSTIFSALCYALTGETIQGLSSNLNNIFTNGNMSVQLDFFADDIFYSIIRSRDTKNKADLKIFVNNEDKSGKGVRESQEILNTLLPELTSDLIGEVIVIGQGMPHKFSNNTPSGRKDLLEKLSHSDFMLEDIKERIANRDNILKLNSQEIAIKKTKLTTEKEIIENNIKLKVEELSKYNDKPDFSLKKNDLNNNISIKEKLLLELGKSIDEKTKLFDKITDDLLTLTKEKNSFLENETNEFNNHNIDIKTKLAEAQMEKKALEKEINNLESVKDICPLCKQKLPHVHKQDTSKQREQLKTLIEEIEKLTEKNNNQENAYKLNITDIKNSFKEKEDGLLKEKETYKTQINKLNSDIQQNNCILNNLKVSLNDIIREEKLFDDTKEKLNNEIESLKNNLTKINTDLLYIINSEKEVLTHQETLAKINTLVKRDFRGILLSNIINYIDKKCKQYALDIFHNDELTFKLDGNNLNITYCNKPLEALSGGEQQKVDLIIQFAIRAMMQEYTHFTSNIIVLDEILDNLDSVGCDSILNFITTKLSDIESIFIISHHADTLNIGNDSTITVVKNADGVSYII